MVWIIDYSGKFKTFLVKIVCMAVFLPKSLELTNVKDAEIMLLGFHITLTHPNIRNPGDFLETARVPKRQDTIFSKIVLLLSATIML